MLNYFHFNPVTAGFVNDPWHWKYSSTVDYMPKDKACLTRVFRVNDAGGSSVLEATCWGELCFLRVLFKRAKVCDPRFFLDTTFKICPLEEVICIVFASQCKVYLFAVDKIQFLNV